MNALDFANDILSVSVPDTAHEMFRLYVSYSSYPILKP